VRHCVLFLLVLAMGCGSKSPLRIPQPARDGGMDDGGPDAGPDAGVIDHCVELPYREPPREVSIAFSAQILSADIYFLVDVTGSMGEEIDQIRVLLREDIVPGLAAEIPDVRFSVGHFADFPLPELNYGEATDELFRLLQTSTDDIEDVQRAVNLIPLQGGRDGPEALIEGIYLSASGEGIGEYAPASSCPRNTVGYPCFRPQGSRIFLAFTDAPTHNGPGDRDAYEGIRPEPHSYQEAVGALREIGARVLGLYSGGDGGFGFSDLQNLARDTGAVRPDGEPIVFDIGRDGRFLSASVVEAVRTLVEEVPIDVDVLIEDVEGDPIDATQFVVQVIADRAEPPEGAINLGDRFGDVRPGTRVFFRIVLANELLPQTDEPQSFYLRVVLRGDGITRLEETIVQIVVPGIGGGFVCSR
jgi:hypothetical protein